MTPIMPKFRTVCSLQSFKENEHAIMNPAYSLTLKKIILKIVILQNVTFYE